VAEGGPGLPFVFKRMIHWSIRHHSTVANCMDWAKHRRRKAAAKCHLRLNLASFLPALRSWTRPRHSEQEGLGVVRGPAGRGS